MDHANAHLMEYNHDTVTTNTIDSQFTREVKEASIHKSEGLMHHKEQHQEAGYYHALGNVIKNYEHVLLFGPTDAKTELYNLLHADPQFAHINIDVLPADKMTENQQHAFIKNHFSK